MRGLHIPHDEAITSGNLSRLSQNTPGGVLFPRLEWLHWDWYLGERGVPLTFFRLFISPHLKHVDLNTLPTQPNPYIPWRQLASLVQMISVLPTSLEHLSLVCGPQKDGPLRDAISSLVRRCGPSLKSFDSCVPLSEAAIHHLTQLPNLRRWSAIQGTPRTVPLPVLPSIEEITLTKQAALPWVHLLASRENGTSGNGPAPGRSHTNIGVALKSLGYPTGTTIDSTFLSSVVKFRNLVTLYVQPDCSDGCVFRLRDDDMGDLAATLPHLVKLQLGQPCDLNFCNTTVASLLAISTHCLDLLVLEIHFNTRTIVDDMKRLVDGGLGCDKIRCKLHYLMAGDLPLEVRGEDNEAVAMGFRIIFPCLRDILAHDREWYELRFQLRGMQSV